MIANILQNGGLIRLFGFTFLIILVYGGIFALIIIALIRFVKFLSSVPKEQKLLRMELGKLAEEVHQIRKELKDKEA